MSASGAVHADQASIHALPGGPHVPRRSLLLSIAAALAAAALLYVFVPQLAGLDETWRRLSDGDPWWLVLALFLEVLSFAGYVAVFRGVAGDGGADAGWGVSYRITMAGVAATRLLATAGAGGVALTAWALRSLGMPARLVAERISALLVALYAVFMLALVAGGATLLWSEAEPAPVALTTVPAAFGALVILLGAGLARLPPPAARDRPSAGAHWWSRAGHVLATAPAVFGAGVRKALEVARRRDPALLGSPAWWGFDMAVLWAAFEAFGGAPALGVLVMGYCVGMLANAIPLPGGVGGVEGGMIGAFIGLGVPTGLAIVAVLTYRAYAFWLPTIPGVLAFVGLRHSLEAHRL